MARGDHAIWLVIFYSCISNPSAQTVRLYINALVAMVRLRITLGHLTALTRHLSWIWGSGFAAKRGRQGREGKERTREEGSLERKGDREMKVDSKGKGREREGDKREKDRKGVGICPLQKYLREPMFLCRTFQCSCKNCFLILHGGTLARACRWTETFRCDKMHLWIVWRKNYRNPSRL